MTITNLTADILTHSLYTGVSPVYPQFNCGHSINRTTSDFQTVTNKVIIMSTYVQQLHQAKIDTLNSASLYASTMQAIVNEFGIDTASIGRIVLESLNSDYPVVETRDSKILKTALNSFQNAAHTAGELLADGIGGRVVFKFSTAGGKNDKVRTVTVVHQTQAQVDTIAERIIQDDAIATERAETDAKLETEKRETERDNLSDLDVFLRIKQDMAAQFPHHEVKAMLSAGMGWCEQEELNALTDADVEILKQA
jgi:hypothetical protein